VAPGTAGRGHPRDDRAVTLTTWTYAVFLALAVGLRLLVPPRLTAGLLLALSLLFYAWGTPADLVVLLPLIGAVHLIAERATPDRGHAGRWLAAGVLLCVGVLAYDKYLGLAVEALNGASAFLGMPLHWTAPRVDPPLGVSFFVFLLIHYLVEVRRGNVAPIGLGQEALFVLFFPTVVAGPLKRLEGFAPQLREATHPAPADLHEGLSRIVVGLAKKTLVADQIAPLTHSVFQNPDGFGWDRLWLASYGYAVQIYFDFAGYSDMAIGSARVLGFRVPENFDYPYFRTNIAQFWRHWHMTLTGWIMQYVYFPLGGNRRGEIRAVSNRLVAMTLCGLWHGSAFHFAVWGAYHGLLLNLFHLYRRLRARLRPERPGGSNHPAAVLASGLLTFHLVVIGWVFFATDLDRAVSIIGRLLFLTPTGGLAR